MEYFVRDLQSQKQLSDKDRQLRVIQKKIDNYQRLNERIREDNPGIQETAAKKTHREEERKTNHRQRNTHREYRKSHDRRKRS